MQAELDAIKNLPEKQRKIEENRIVEKYNHERAGKYCLATANFDSKGALYATRILTSDNLTRGMNILFSTRKDEAERTRAKDFFMACKYATTHFKELPFITEDDIIFLEKDYRRRLDSKYNSLSDTLKKEFFDLYFS